MKKEEKNLIKMPIQFYLPYSNNRSQFYGSRLILVEIEENSTIKDVKEIIASICGDHPDNFFIESDKKDRYVSIDDLINDKSNNNEDIQRRSFIRYSDYKVMNRMMMIKNEYDNTKVSDYDQLRCMVVNYR